MAAGFRLKRLFRISIAMLLLAALCIWGYQGGYRNGYEIGDPGRAKQTLVVVDYDVNDLLGPDYSASGIKQTTDGLIALIQSDGTETSRRHYMLNAIQRPNYGIIQVNAYPYMHKEVERLLKQIREPAAR